MGSYNRRVITRAEWDLRQRQWAEFDDWLRTAPPLEISSEEAMAEAGALLDWVPGLDLEEQRDRECRGVQRMHALLGLLSR